MTDLSGYEFGRVYAEDATTALAKLPDKSIECILTDPPYGIDIGDGTFNAEIGRKGGFYGHNGGSKRRKTSTVANDGPEATLRLVKVLVEQAARILKPDSAFCCFTGGGGPKTIYADAIKLVDTYLEFDTAVVWNKKAIGVGHRYRQCYDLILIAHRKGGRLRWFDKTKAVRNIIDIWREEPKHDDHDTPKPVKLMEFLLRLHTQPGDVVLDPYAGRGPTLIGCLRLNRQFVGFDIDPTWAERANLRAHKERERLGVLTQATAGTKEQIGLFSTPSTTTLGESST